MGDRRIKMALVVVGVLALAGSIAGVAVAETGGGSSPSPAHHNSAGCVPADGNGTPNTDPDACGPGNYPMSAFYRDSNGHIGMACGDHVRGPNETTTTVPHGEPDPSCHPMSQSDMARANQTHESQSNPPAPTP